jgi:hypothetical protein
MKKLILIISLFLYQLCYSGPRDKIYGVTIDSVSPIDEIVISLSKLNKKPTTRIVFDDTIKAANYLYETKKIHEVSYIMGEILDSPYYNNYTVPLYEKRVRDYLDVLGDYVDIWEIGNEVNGEWVNPIDKMSDLIQSAFNIVKLRNKKTELTLYYNVKCFTNPKNEMFRWVNENISQQMKNELDYVLVSYYTENCVNSEPDWSKIFDSLQVIFPNSKLGIGECGTENPVDKESFIKKFYSINVNNRNFIGGYFWWYFLQDCVPYTNRLFNVVNGTIKVDAFLNSQDGRYPVLLQNYPNPFNSVTTIHFSIPANSFVSIKVYDVSGKEISELVNGFIQKGIFSINFDGEKLSSGIYFCRIQSGNFLDTKKMVLVK